MLNQNAAKINMDKICRSCLCENLQMKSLFETNIKNEEEPQMLAQMIMECTSIKVCNGDGLPESVCENCEMKLVLAYEFKQQFEKSDERLRNLANVAAEKENLKAEYDNNDVSMDDVNNYQSESETDDVKPQIDDDLKCTICSKIVRSKLALSRHYATTHNKMCCEICLMKFSTEYQYNAHMDTHQPTDDFKHVCDECGMSFTRAYYLFKHKREHKNVVEIKKEEELVDDALCDAEIESQESTNKALNKFECSDCREVLITYDDLKIHMRKHTKQKIVNCKVCDKSFTKMSHLNKHLRTKHFQEAVEKKVMECEFCDRKFKYKKSFNHHMQTEHGMEEQESDNNKSPSDTINPAELVEASVETDKEDEGQDESNEVFSDSKDKDVSPRRNHVCHVCGSSFTRTNHLTRHMTLHRSLLVFKCDNCDKSFATEEYLNKHQQDEHISKPYICTVCNKTFSRGEHLIRHLKQHAPEEKPESRPKCSICLVDFSRSDHLARHIKLHLKQDKRHVCECGKAFNRLDNLKTHQRIHTGQKDNSKLHLCIYCGKEFNNSSNMIVHMRRHTGERPYKCSQCDKGFPRSHDLKCHERTHSGEKPYLCTLCGKSFNKSNKLLRHTRVHTGERPYVCSLCNRGFTQSNDLSLHMRRHTGSRPYACGVCPARFIQSGQLKTHRKSTGHWMETQPDLKGAHRVEPVVPLTEPTPIKFKKHGRINQVNDIEEGEKVDDPAYAEKQKPIQIAAENINLLSMQPILVDNKILEQFPQINFAANLGNSFVIADGNKVKLVTQEEKERLEAGAVPTFQTFATSSTSGSFTNNESYNNYETYG